jgi:hypothetical protein
MGGILLGCSRLPDICYFFYKLERAIEIIIIFIMYKILYGIIFLWELPQNILGIIVWLFSRHKISKAEILHGRLFFQTTGFGISLGSFIFFSNSDNDTAPKTSPNKAHEYGHAIQSLIFGPLYLILVGFPSVSRYIYSSIYFRIKKIGWKNYYKGYPENWADKLGKRHY